MIFFTNQKCELKYPVVTMGTFDGVHLGHRKLLERLVEKAKETGGEAVVISYYHHPLETIHKKTFPYLLTERDKKEELLKEMGIDCVQYLNFTEEMAQMGPDEFLETVILAEVGAKELIVGYDTHFGKYRSGDYKYLKENEERFGFKVELVTPYEMNNKIISSSVIRDFIREGSMRDAAKCLGRDYSISGKIIEGHKIGRKLGFPTINLHPDDSHKLIPALGVYIVKVKMGEEVFQGLTNIGYSPTIKTTGIKEVETFILDFDRDVYYHRVEVVFLKKLRDELAFDSKEELIEAINKDVDEAREYFRNEEA